MPLTMVAIGEKCIVRRVSGKEEVGRHLAELGFVAGTEVSVVSKMGENLIVQVKDSRIAIGQDLAKRVLVDIK